MKKCFRSSLVWCSGLRIRPYHCSGLGHWGTSMCHGCVQKKKKRAALDGRELPFMIGGLREAGVCMNGLSDI